MKNLLLTLLTVSLLILTSCSSVVGPEVEKINPEDLINPPVPCEFGDDCHDSFESDSLEVID